MLIASNIILWLYIIKYLIKKYIYIYILSDCISVLHGFWAIQNPYIIFVSKIERIYLLYI